MSRTAALARARSLREALHDHGVERVSIELQQGRPGTPHSRWYDTRFVAALAHHIVSRRSMGSTPGLSIVKFGRKGLPGPLANGYGGFDETYRIICMGWANHPGAGGPWTVPGGTIPRDQGRPYLWGTEYEGGLVLSDWTDSFREFMGRSNAAVCDWLGVDERSHGEHLTWAPWRKIDRLSYTTGSGRSELRPYLEGDIDMLDTDDKNWLKYTQPEYIAKAVREEVAKITDLRWGKILAQRNNAILTSLGPRVRTLLELASGSDAESVLARLDEMDQRAATERAAILAAVESVESGESSAEDALRLLRDVLNDADRLNDDS